MLTYLDVTVAEGATGPTAGRKGILLALAPMGALLIGVLVRLWFVLQADFPLHDGGLFYLMTEELQRAHYRLPLYTAYNGARIPFAYPPLGLYLAGLLSDLGHWPLIELFRFLPLILNALTILAFYGLARAMLSSRAGVAIAVFVFALLPRSFQWLIVGGGVTRALGLLFAVLAIRHAYLLYARRDARHLLPTIVFTGCTLLSHLEMAVFLAASLAVLFLACGRRRAGLVQTVLIGTGSVLLAAPWWGAVVARHGLAPFLAAGHHGWPLFGGLTDLLVFQVTDEPFFPVLGILALLGVLACLAERRFLLPVWLLALFAVDPRAARTDAIVPLALLASVGAQEVLLPLLRRAPGGGVSGAAGAYNSTLLAGVAVFITFSAVMTGLAADVRLLVGLSAEEREAMRWVAANTPPSSTFIVITGEKQWGCDRSAEWFPVLADRTSLGTAQGYEWLDGFAQRVERAEELQGCASKDLGCVEQWAREGGLDFDYIYIAKRRADYPSVSTRQCCPGLESILRSSPGYEMVYDSAGASVFRRVRAAGRAVARVQLAVS